MNLAQLRQPRILIGLSAVAAVLILIIASVLGVGAATKLHLSGTVATNITYTHQVDDETVQFFTGSSFASYNPTNGGTTTLSPLFSLPRLITDVKWCGDHALMSATGYSSVDQLYPELVKKNLSPDGYYWWDFNLITKTFSLVGTQAGSFRALNVICTDDGYDYSQANAAGDVAVYTITGTKVTDLPHSATLIATASGAVLYSVPSGGKEVVSVVTNGQTKKVAENAIGFLGGGGDGSALIIQKSDATKDDDAGNGRLLYFKSPTSQPKTLDTNFIGKATQLPGGWLVTGTNANGGVAYLVEGSKTSNFTIENTDDKARFNIYTPVAKIDAKHMLVTTNRGELMHASAKKLKVTESPSLARLQSTVNETAFRMSYNAGEDLYSVYIKQNPYTTSQQAAIRYIKTAGFDPNQIRLKWYAYDNVDTGFKLPAAITPAQEPLPVVPLDYDLGD